MDCPLGLERHSAARLAQRAGKQRGAPDRGAIGGGTAFTVPAISLIGQTVDAFEREGINCVGVMQADHERTDHTQPVQVCSVATLARREKPDAALVIIDEAHLGSKSVHDWMADPAWANVPFIGLSATPWTRGLGKHFDDLIVAARTDDLIAAEYQPSTRPSPIWRASTRSCAS